MMGRRMLALWVAVLFAAGMLAGCASPETGESGLLLYYVRGAEAEGSSALETEAWSGEEEVDALVDALIQNPDGDGLYTVIPAGTTLEGWSLNDGLLRLNLSGEYGTLSGVELTLANACLVMTLCQLEQVDGVTITAEGELLTEDVVLQSEMFALEGGGGDQATMAVTLYFLTEAGGIQGEQRSLLQSENRSRAEEIFSALCDGPESRALLPVLPERPEDISLWLEDEICYINLTREWKEAMEESLLGARLRCVTLSLCQLEGIGAVQFLLDGAAIEDWDSNGADYPLTQ